MKLLNGLVAVMAADGTLSTRDLGSKELIECRDNVYPLREVLPELGEGEEIGPSMVTFEKGEAVIRYEVIRPVRRLHGYEIISRIEALIGTEATDRAIVQIQTVMPTKFARMMSASQGVPTEDPHLVAALESLGMDPKTLLAE